MSSRALTLILFGLLAGSCSVDVKNGVFACTTDADCPSGLVCRADGRCWDSPDPTAPLLDAALGDGPIAADRPRVDGAPDLRDATSDDALAPEDQDARSPGEDADTTDSGTDLDATPVDLGIDAGACVPTAGDRCDRTDYCGSTVDCDGACGGGTRAPACSCGAPTCGRDGAWACPDPATLGDACSTAAICGGRIACDGTCSDGTAAPACPCGAALCVGGQWSSCPGPADYGQACGTTARCGGTIACDGTCNGGSAAPTCPCGPATCQNGTTWSACPAPADFGTACNLATRCGARVDCSGACSGGTALPSCPQCGTPSCDGTCSQGQCGASSTCSPTTGLCQCAVDECACSAPNSSCTLCQNGQIGGCVDDAYGCGDFTATDLCEFGCGTGPAMCACAPDTGQQCFDNSCACSCGDVSRPGTRLCDGRCLPSGSTCVALCRAFCGVEDPR